MSEKCTLGVSNQTEINNLKIDVRDMKDSINRIEQRLIGRPTWTVTAIISILTFIATGSVTFALTVLNFITVAG